MTFDLSVSVPRDVRFLPTVRALAVHAAAAAGYSGEAAEAFGRRVEEVAHQCLADGSVSGDVPIVLRHTDGPMEVLVDARSVTLQV